MNRKEKIIQVIRAYLLADENAPTGEERAKLLEELHELELAVQNAVQN